ncbi:MAG: hypothetical protein ACR2KV_15055 [Solirubrobacteraceae bacterium]
MSQAARRILKPELGGNVPERLDALDEGELAGFAATLQTARHRRSQELELAVEQAFDIVPRLLRGTVPRFLFG